jgi:hypothetical protein
VNRFKITIVVVYSKKKMTYKTSHIKLTIEQQVPHYSRERTRTLRNVVSWLSFCPSTSLYILYIILLAVCCDVLFFCMCTCISVCLFVLFCFVMGFSTLKTSFGLNLINTFTFCILIRNRQGYKVERKHDQ